MISQGVAFPSCIFFLSLIGLSDQGRGFFVFREKGVERIIPGEKSRDSGGVQGAKAQHGSLAEQSPCHP